MNADVTLRLVVGCALMAMLFVAAIAWYLLLHSRRQHAAALALARLERESENRILAARIEESERVANALSRDIHDGVGQRLDLLHMMIKAASESGGVGTQAAAHLQSAGALVADVSSELRQMAYSLNSDYIGARGLGEVLQKELDWIEASRGIRCSLEITGVYRSLPSQTELLLYRIAQEALHNAAKHSGASCITVGLHYAPARFSMRITDDGCGFDAAEVSSGLGLQNMRQRAALLGAEWRLEASPGNGCSVAVVLDEEA